MAVRYMAHHEWLEAIREIGTQWIERCAVAGIAEVVRELDDLGHAAKVLTKHDILAEPDLSIGVQATLRRKRMLVRDAVQVVALPLCDGIVGDSHTVGTDLLIVTDDHHP